MDLLQSDFIKELAAVILSTLLFSANCAFVFLPATFHVHGAPGQPLTTQPNGLE